jgi:hypothetical protein
VIGFDENTGFLLVHSTPRFPVTVPAEYIHERVVLLNLSKNQTIYGQHYFCTSTKTFDLENKIAPSYLTNDVYVYDGKMPLSFEKKFPNLSKFVKNEYVRLYQTG